MKEAANRGGLQASKKITPAGKAVLARSARRAPAAAAVGTAHPVVERAAPTAAERPAGGFLDRREILRLRGDIRGSARGLGVGFEGERARQQNRRRRNEGDHQLAHRFSP